MRRFPKYEFEGHFIIDCTSFVEQRSRYLNAPGITQACMLLNIWFAVVLSMHIPISPSYKPFHQGHIWWSNPFELPISWIVTMGYPQMLPCMLTLAHSLIWLLIEGTWKMPLGGIIFFIYCCFTAIKSLAELGSFFIQEDRNEIQTATVSRAFSPVSQEQ